MIAIASSAGAQQWSEMLRSQAQSSRRRLTVNKEHNMTKRSVVLGRQSALEKNRAGRGLAVLVRVRGKRVVELQRMGRAAFSRQRGGERVQHTDSEESPEQEQPLQRSSVRRMPCALKK